MSRSLAGAAAALALFAAFATGSPVAAADGGSYEDLVALFHEWRAFQQPRRVAGVPDYGPPAMAAQQRELPGYRRRLEALDRRGWSIAQQVDYHLVRAEMNGLDFDHRVLRPWANNPAFYVTVFAAESDQPAREGPFAAGAIELWTYTFPLAPARAAELEAGLRAVPGLLQQARANLVGDGSDLWTFGAAALREQAETLEALEAKLAGATAGLAAHATAAREATAALATWVESQARSKQGPSGVGVANYDWYLKHVQLAPYTWREEVALIERELARAHALLAMEEARNAGLPQQQPIASAEEHQRRFAAAVTEYVAFLRDHDVLTVTDDMDAALRARLGGYRTGPREFFSEVDYRDPVLMRTHGYHWFDKARMLRAPHPSPIRRGPLLYNIFDTRTEGHATGWEELMTQAGMFDARPRTRELTYVLLAQRAARALGELKMHGEGLPLEQAAAFAAAHTPRGWLSLEGQLVRWEQHLYLQQPGYGTSYVIGKIEIEKLLAERRRQLGERFSFRQFMEEFEAAGLVPAALLRWELTGELPEDVARMLEPDGR